MWKWSGWFLKNAPAFLKNPSCISFIKVFVNFFDKVYGKVFCCVLMPKRKFDWQKTPKIDFSFGLS